MKICEKKFFQKKKKIQKISKLWICCFKTTVHTIKLMYCINYILLQYWISSMSNMADVLRSDEIIFEDDISIDNEKNLIHLNKCKDVIKVCDV